MRLGMWAERIFWSFGVDRASGFKLVVRFRAFFLRACFFLAKSRQKKSESDACRDLGYQAFGVLARKGRQGWKELGLCTLQTARFAAKRRRGICIGCDA